MLQKMVLDHPCLVLAEVISRLHGMVMSIRFMTSPRAMVATHRQNCPRHQWLHTSNSTLALTSWRGMSVASLLVSPQMAAKSHSPPSTQLHTLIGTAWVSVQARHYVRYGTCHQAAGTVTSMRSSFTQPLLLVSIILMWMV